MIRVHVNGQEPAGILEELRDLAGRYPGEEGLTLVVHDVDRPHLFLADVTVSGPSTLTPAYGYRRCVDLLARLTEFGRLELISDDDNDGEPVDWDELCQCGHPRRAHERLSDEYPSICSHVDPFAVDGATQPYVGVCMCFRFESWESDE